MGSLEGASNRHPSNNKGRLERPAAMTTIPDACIQFTKVFAFFKLEIAIAVVVGVLIGFFAERLKK